MTGKRVAESFWAILKQRGFEIVDGDNWDTVDPTLKVVWEQFAKELRQEKFDVALSMAGDDFLQVILDWPEELRQRLYMLLNAAGHRIR